MCFLPPRSRPQLDTSRLGARTISRAGYLERQMKAISGGQNPNDGEQAPVRYDPQCNSQSTLARVEPVSPHPPQPAPHRGDAKPHGNDITQQPIRVNSGSEPAMHNPRPNEQIDSTLRHPNNSGSDDTVYGGGPYQQWHKNDDKRHVADHVQSEIAIRILQVVLECGDAEHAIAQRIQDEDPRGLGRDVAVTRPSIENRFGEESKGQGRGSGDRGHPLRRSSIEGNGPGRVVCSGESSQSREHSLTDWSAGKIDCSGDQDAKGESPEGTERKNLRKNQLVRLCDQQPDQSSKSN